MQQHHDGLLGAAGGDHVLRRGQAAVVLFGVADDGLLERWNAVRRSVFHVARAEQGRATHDGVDGRFALRLAAPRWITGSPLSRSNAAVSFSFRVGDSDMDLASWLKLMPYTSFGI